MLNLSDVNRLTNSYDGDIYSDLYKDVYGCRPRGAQFESLEDFDKDFDFLAKCLDRMIDEEKIEQQKNIEAFEARVAAVQEIVVGADREAAINIIIQGEDLEDDFAFYGYECLEYRLKLPYGYIKENLN